MIDQSVISEIVGFFETGVVDGAETDITRVYTRNRDSTVEDLPDPEVVVHVIEKAATLLGDELAGEPLVQRPHFLMLVAAVMYSEGLLPASKLELENVPSAPFQVAADDEVAAALVELNAALETDVGELSTPLAQFVGARTSTQRIRSRQVRFEHFCRALTGQSIAE